jgi:hypothetical protein
MNLLYKQTCIKLDTTQDGCAAAVMPCAMPTAADTVAAADFFHHCPACIAAAFNNFMYYY